LAEIFKVVYKIMETKGVDKNEAEKTGVKRKKGKR
jgi:hypothetical protein